MTRKLIFSLVLSLLVVSSLSAQSSSGQLCIRAFEDRNGNAVQDANEPPIVRGLSATLSDATGLIIDTALMESSSTASSGTLCFQRLEAGQYSIRVTSADYVPTTPRDLTAAISDTGVPQVLSFGGQFIPVELPESATGISQEARLQGTVARGVIGLIGAVIVMGAMAVVGAVIYFFVLRNQRPAPAGAYYPVSGTGQYPAVTDSGQYRAVSDSGQYPAVSDSGSYPAVAGDTPSRGMAPISEAEFADSVHDMYEDDDTSKPQAPAINADPYVDVPDDDFQFEDDEDAAYRPPANE